MRHKNDIALAATTARSYNRHWRAQKLSWTEIGKIKYLFDGAYEYMDDVTLAYRKEQFNELRCECLTYDFRVLNHRFTMR